MKHHDLGAARARRDVGEEPGRHVGRVDDHTADHTRGRRRSGGSARWVEGALSSHAADAGP